MTPDTLVLDGQLLTLDNAKQIAGGVPLFLGPNVKKRVDAASFIVKERASDPKTPYYGINTGFGYFANQRISDAELLLLQENIIKSHASGWGEPFSIEVTRLAMALRLNVLIQGFTGVRYLLCEALLHLIQKEIYPVIPQYGSVGASGDLIPLSHLSLPLIGEGEVFYKGKRVSAKEALQKEGLSPIVLAEKEGLGLVNGTQVMLAVGGVALSKALELLRWADRIAALSYEGLTASLSPLNPLIHRVRRQKGQIKSGEAMLEALEGSFLQDAGLKRRRVQDPYSLRCAPQVHGAARDTLTYVTGVVEDELNAVTDNPLVFPEEDLILSGGNFHGEPLAIAFDCGAIAVSELANISDRRLEVLLNPALSGLPAFLARREGVNSGYMCLQYLSASLVNENKVLSHPASTDSIPGNVGIEDHVSMGMTSARKFAKIIENSYVVLACEAIAAAEAIDQIGKGKVLGKKTKPLYEAIREGIAPLTEDRIVSGEIEWMVALLKSGEGYDASC